ncbi:hypothetical protein ND748_31245 [Frankia sp. AiPs1]|uniref:hypothetical protein n=1 Tax=Frankia sp. AiPs1 TaxID=573493 RepID=UPI0020436CEB|nr:hypothetical protein [Frankia sp. AiPs1]MCM3926132.1 hypothetical protein [Frankia sp. AiPs1]
MKNWRALALAAIVAVLAACGGSGGAGGSAGTRAGAAPSAGASAAGGVSAFDLVHDSEAAATFVTAFRGQFPALATGRSDTALRDDGTHICLDDLPAGGDRLALARIPARFADGGITPDQPTSGAILALARSTVCAAASTP